MRFCKKWVYFLSSFGVKLEKLFLNEEKDE